jgi:hypothetical protein
MSMDRSVRFVFSILQFLLFLLINLRLFRGRDNLYFFYLLIYSLTSTQISISMVTKRKKPWSQPKNSFIVTFCSVCVKFQLISNWSKMDCEVALNAMVPMARRANCTRWLWASGTKEKVTAKMLAFRRLNQYLNEGNSKNWINKA